MRLFAVSLATFLLLLTSSPALPAEQEVFLDAQKMGRTFEGFGALSAGASSKLLIDYPEPQRSQILDLLFKPKYGASLQQLKVEIGGDVNSTCGTEPAFAHTREEFAMPDASYFKRGYEWWVMQEARKRAPKILFDALQWGAPGWIGGGKFYSQDNADFVAAFHAAAREHLRIETAYQGIWNETMSNTEWIKTLRSTLDRAGLSGVRIGAADQSEEEAKWRIAEDAEKDPELARAIYAFGDHYVGYQSSPAAQRSGKPLWAAEDGPWAGDWYGATKLAKLYNRSYIDGKMTRIITWSLITSYYDILPLPGSGLMRANEPWSGHYEIQPGIWAAAHTTQFADPGWIYVDSACGYLKQNGSYVTLRSPDGEDFTIVVETMDSPYVFIGKNQEVTFHLGEGFPEKPVHVWMSSASEQFVKVETIQPKDRTFRYKFSNEAIYTLSTTTLQQKGSADIAIPESKPIALPYKETFDSKPVHALPKYFIDQSGVFEVVDRPDGRGGCLRQVVPSKGIEWHYHGNPAPYTIMGDGRWRDYEVEVDTLLGGPGYAAVYGRVTKVSTKDEPPAGYWLSVDEQGNWKLNRQADVLKSGKARFESDRWQRIGLRFSEDRITVLINGKEQGSATDATYGSGLAGLGCGWQRAYFDDFAILPVKK